MSLRKEGLFEFDEFRLDASTMSLWRGGEMVQIAPKAVEALHALLLRGGGVVTREELLDEVWEGSFVEEGNINYTISLVRRALGRKELIETVPKRGYRIAAEVRRPAPEAPEAPVTPEARETSATPGSPTPVAGSRPARISRWKLVLAATALAASVAAAAVVVILLRRPRETAKATPAGSVEAMQAYTRGRLILDKRSADNREEKAIDEFQSAVNLDPTFAPAYAGLAEVYSTSAVRLGGAKGRDLYLKAKSAVDKALALDPNLAEAYAIRGWIRRCADRDWKGAEEDLRRSAEISPATPNAHYRLAHVLVSAERLDEARAEIDRASELDPTSETVQQARYAVLEARGEMAEALRSSEEFWRENKKSPQAARAYATFLFHSKRFAEVISLGEPFIAGEQKPFGWLSLLEAAYREERDPATSDRLLAELEKSAASDSKARYSLAMNYAERGRADDAVAALFKCFEDGEERLSWLGVEPRFASLRRDPRFVELKRRLGLPV